MARMRAEDILFWILILAVIAIATWLAFGSPGFENSLIAIIIFVASSEILLWRFLFSIDKKTAIGFERVKNRMGNMETSLKERLKNIEVSLNKIEIRLRIR